MPVDTFQNLFTCTLVFAIEKNEKVRPKLFKTLNSFKSSFSVCFIAFVSLYKRINIHQLKLGTELVDLQINI